MFEFTKTCIGSGNYICPQTPGLRGEPLMKRVATWNIWKQILS
jgi:hypothetical protein